VYYDGGGAHPNNYFVSLTYDLAANKEIKFDDLFQPGADYKTAIAKFLVTDIDKRAYAVEQKDATDPKQVPKHDEPIVSQDQLTELSGWGLTPKGLVVYFDFPHVIGIFRQERCSVRHRQAISQTKQSRRSMGELVSGLTFRSHHGSFNYG
jgi:hypothetical protein